MTTYGARSYLAAPLELRTATLLQLANPALPLGPEVGVSSNRLLMTAGGMLAPQDAVSLSSFFASTLSVSTALLSTLPTHTTDAAAITASTIYLGPTTFSTLTGSTLSGTTLVANLLTAPSLTTTLLNSSTMIGDLGSAVTLSTLSYRLGMDAVNMTLSIGSLHASTIAVGITRTETASASTMTATTVSTQMGSTSLLAANTLAVASLSASTLSFVDATADHLTVGGVSLASTFRASSLLAENTTYDLLSTTYLSTTIISTTILTGSTLLGNTAVFSTVQTSSITAGTLSWNTLVSGLSAITAQDIWASTASASTIRMGTVYGSTVTIVGLLTASSITAGSTLLSSMSTSTVTASFLSASTLSASTVTGSLTVGLIRVPVATASTVTASTMTVDPVIAGSTIVLAASLTTLQTSTFGVSTLTVTATTGSTLVTSSLAGVPLPMRITASTMTVSTLGVSTLNGTFISAAGLSAVSAATSPATTSGLLMLGGSYSGAASTALLAGYQAAPAGIAVSSLIAVGAFAASTLQTCPSGIYLGAYAQASGANTDEGVIGSGIGSGTGTLTIGTASTLLTRLYGSVGIGTTTPLATLDVRGSTVCAAASTIYNTTIPGAVGDTVSLTLTTGTQTARLFVNDSLALGDGGASAATLQCAAGLQVVGGALDAGMYVTAAGTVGIGTTEPVGALDVRGVVTCQVDGASGEMPSNDSVAVFAPLLSASMWMGYDPVLGAGYLNAGQTASPWPIVLQPTGGSVGIGTTAPRARLDVMGTSVFTGVQVNDLSVESATVGGWPLVSGSQWTVAPGVLSYANISVGSVRADTYVGLPVATADSAGTVQIGAGLTATDGVLSVTPPFLSCRCAGSTTAWNNEWVVELTPVYQQGIAVSGTGTIGVTTAGRYEMTISGTADTADTFVWQDAVQVGQGPGIFFLDLTTTTTVTVTSPNQTGLEAVMVCMWMVAAA